MDLTALILLTLCFLVFSCLSRFVHNSILSAPMLFVGFGILFGSAGLGWFSAAIDLEVLHLLAEVTLVLVLFHDASRIKLASLRHSHAVPLRMLLLGLPMTVALGAFIAWWLPLGLNIWESCLLAALLAPTDAALGQAVVESPAVPARVRQALNVESGLNDGFALPLVLVFASVAAVSEGQTAGEWFAYAGAQIVLGPIAGLAVGWFGGWMTNFVKQREMMTETAEGISVLAIAALAFAAAEFFGGNGFISAFVAGLTFGTTLNKPASFLFEFAETEGQLLTLSTFFLLGAVLVAPQLVFLDWWVFLYALLSLTIIRMLPVALSLLGLGLKSYTLLFLGWFGPRGLATVIYVLLVQQNNDSEQFQLIGSIALVTVVLSVILHGMTAQPGARLYSRWTNSEHTEAESQPVPELPTRRGLFRPDGAHS